MKSIVELLLFAVIFELIFVKVTFATCEPGTTMRDIVGWCHICDQSKSRKICSKSLHHSKSTPNCKCTTECNVQNEHEHLFELNQKEGYSSYTVCVKACPLNYLVLNNTQCVVACPANAFKDLNRHGRCEYCHTDCNGCTSYGTKSSQCKKCKHVSFKGHCLPRCTNGFKNNNGKCVESCPNLQYKDTCVKNCPKQTYLNESRKECFRCHKECAQCSGPDNGKDCQKCQHIRFQGKCFSKCPATAPLLYKGNCKHTCPAYNHNNQCLEKCPAYMVGYNHNCLDNCPDHVPAILDGECLEQCPPAFSITGNTCMRKCQPKKVHYNKQCINECPAAAPFVEQSECVNKCSNITLDKMCFDSCPGELGMYNMTCVHQCPPEARFRHPVTKVCSSMCPYYVLDGNQCLEVCPNAAYDSKCINSCPPEKPYKKSIYDPVCVTKCEHLVNNVTCVDECPVHSFIFNNMCVPSCPAEKPYADPDNLMCLAYCPYFLSNGVCVKTCPINTHQEAKQCVPCPKECTAATKCQNPNCTKCDIFIDEQDVKGCAGQCSHHNAPMLMWGSDPPRCVKECPGGRVRDVVDKQIICAAHCHSLLNIANLANRTCDPVNMVNFVVANVIGGALVVSYLMFICIQERRVANDTKIAKALILKLENNLDLTEPDDTQSRLHVPDDPFFTVNRHIIRHNNVFAKNISQLYNSQIEQ